MIDFLTCVLVLISPFVLIFVAYHIAMRLCDKFPSVMMAYPGLENLYRLWYKKNGHEYVIEKTSIPAGDRVIMGLCNKIPSLVQSSEGLGKYMEWRRIFPSLKEMYPVLEKCYIEWCEENNIEH